MTNNQQRLMLSGDEAVAHGALDAGVALGVGYPGTPSTEILEHLAVIGGRAQWAPNEKVALEVGIGASFGGSRSLVTMKHVGVNVAADPLFTAAYTGSDGGLVIVSADDPGMASSQNEQDNRRYAVAAGVPILEPSDSQEAYDMAMQAFEISERWRIPVILRLTTRICHSQTPVTTVAEPVSPQPANFERDVKRRVMVPAYARPAHVRLREKLSAIQTWNETSNLNKVIPGSPEMGIITSGVSYMHAQEAFPNASFFKVGCSYPLPLQALREFVASVSQCFVVEEGDPYLVESLRAEGLSVIGKPEMYRFGELNVNRVKRIIAGDTSPEPVPPRGKPPQLCVGCPHRVAYQILKDLDCIVSGDIGCYTLGVLPPFESIDTCVCMGASIGVGLGLRHVLPEDQARRVVSVIGDSTFVHSGLTGIAEMVYNPPKTGHLVLILDNSTTAMTGLQEHPGTGRTLDHQPTNQMVFEEVIPAMGVPRTFVLNPATEGERFAELVKESLEGNELTVIIARRPCLLVAGKIREYEKAR